MERLAPVLTAGDFSFEFREPANLPNPMLVLDAVACGYRGLASGSGGLASGSGGLASGSGGLTSGSDERTVVARVSRSVFAGQRIGILGANGQGKTTLVKTIARVLAPLAGRITEGKGLAIGYFAQQELDLLRLDEGPLEHMQRLAREVGPQAREQELRDFLGVFRFGGEMVRQPAGTLSGGEKARLVLAMLVWQRPNLLLLDEPTNHLDLDTREALSMALNEYEGSVMLVSHDRALLREVCDEFWLVASGRVEPFDGDLDDYQRWLLERSRESVRGRDAAPEAKAAEAPSPPRANPARDDRKARARLAERTRPLRIELQRVEARLARIGAERNELEALLSNAPPGPVEIAEAGRQLNHIAAETVVLEERWLALSDEIESIAARGP